MQISMLPGAGRVQTVSKIAPTYTNPPPPTAARTETLGLDLKAALNQAFIGTDQSIQLAVNRDGTVATTDGRKQRIEQFFRDRPDLSKKLKDVSALIRSLR